MHANPTQQNFEAISGVGEYRAAQDMHEYYVSDRLLIAFGV
jgi:hypothetical protein